MEVDKDTLNAYDYNYFQKKKINLWLIIIVVFGNGTQLVSESEKARMKRLDELSKNLETPRIA